MGTPTPRAGAWLWQPVRPDSTSAPMRAINKASDGGDWEIFMIRGFDGKEQTIGVNTHGLVYD